jgi:hypothetical protein
VPAPEADPKDHAAEKKEKKSIWKMTVTPVVLVVLGFALLPVALVLYPSSAQTSAPAYARVSVLTNLRITFVTFAVLQVRPGIAEIEVGVVRGTSSAPITGTPSAELEVSPPYGTSFRTCPAPACTPIPGNLGGLIWKLQLAFNPAGDAYAYFYVKAKSFGVSVNGVNALAAIPEVFYSGTGTPEFLVGYHIPSAGSYDWSALPPAAYKGPFVGWTEPLTQDDTPPKVAVGINQARQSSDNHLAFIAGALIGVAGGAVLAGVQEALGRVFK